MYIDQAFLNNSGVLVTDPADNTKFLWQGFAAGVEVNGSAEITALAVGDINGDAAVDLVVGIAGAPNTLYLNKGAELDADGKPVLNARQQPTWLGFGPAQPITADAGATSSVAVGDVDNDGDLDVVVGVKDAANKVTATPGTAPSRSKARAVWRWPRSRA